MGCILYELALEHKAFHDDFTTLQHSHLKAPLELVLDDEALSTQCKRKIETNILSMLQIDPASRPAARDLVEEFSRNFWDCQPIPPSQVEIHQNFQTAGVSKADGTIESLISSTQGDDSVSASETYC